MVEEHMKSSRRRFLGTGAAFAVGLAGGDPSPVSGDSRSFLENELPIKAESLSLRDRAIAKGLFFGAAVDAPILRADSRFRSAIEADCGMLVPGNALKWNWTQTVGGDHPPDFTLAESIYAYAKRHGLKMRGHTLVWHNSIPSWVGRALIDTPGFNSAASILVKHVNEFVSAWKGRLEHWDVVNEPLSSGKDFYWRDILGEQYIDLAFHAAKEADPKAKLVLNQDLLELDDSYQRTLRRRFLSLLERLLRRGVPVEAVGIEGHLFGHLGIDDRELDAFFGEIEGMGLEVLITELDVWDGGMRGDSATRDLNSASLVKRFLDVSLSHKNCIGILAWTLTDLHSWYHHTPDKWRRDGVPNRAGLLDENYLRKPIWYAVASAIDSAVMR